MAGVPGGDAGEGLEDRAAAVAGQHLCGVEDGREENRGLAATVWAKVVAWSFRLALVAGIGLLILMIQGGQNPLKHGHYFHIKLLLVVILLGLSETAPKALAAGKRGSALLALVLFLASSFTVYNKGLFGGSTAPAAVIPSAADTTFTAR